MERDLNCVYFRKNRLFFFEFDSAWRNYGAGFELCLLPKESLSSGSFFTDLICFSCKFASRFLM